MARRIEGMARAARIALACALVVGGAAGADPPPAAPAPEVTAPPPDPAPPPVDRDRLMEIVVQYLDVAFVHEPREDRTAQLQPPAGRTLLNQ